MENNEERPMQIPIPKNFQAGINLFGGSYEFGNIIQGIIMAGLGVFIIFGGCKFLHINASIESRIGFALALGGTLGYLGLAGIEGETLIGLIKNIILFEKNKRTAYYNPRIKKEACTCVFEREDEILPRDKILMMYDKYKQEINKKDQDKALMSQFSLNENEDMFFNDDEGFVDKPLEYMSKKEYKIKQKEEKKKLKEMKGNGGKKQKKTKR